MTITYTENGPYTCAICLRSFETDDSDDIHTDPLTGGDCCAPCCPRCNGPLSDAPDCPACGQSMQVVVNHNDGALYRVECQCGVCGPYETDEQSAAIGWAVMLGGDK